MQGEKIYFRHTRSCFLELIQAGISYYKTFNSHIKMLPAGHDKSVVSADSIRCTGPKLP
jgi:hypothetical protein